MAYTLGNRCTKNCCKRTILVQLIVEDVVTCFKTQCGYNERLIGNRIRTFSLYQFRCPCMILNDRNATPHQSFSGARCIEVCEDRRILSAA